MENLSILLLCDDDPGHANTVLDHIAALKGIDQHKVYTFNPTGLHGSGCLDLDEFDVVVVHYSIAVIGELYLPHFFKEKLRQYRGLKIQFIQDDYRWVDDITAIIQSLGIDILFTLVPEDRISNVWDERKLSQTVKINTLAGYIPDRLLGMRTPSLEERTIDIGYRGRVLPYWLGQLSQEKVWIGKGVLQRAEQYKLRCDIAWKEEDRLYGEAWNRFIGSCKAFLGCESGASITDFDGSAERHVTQYLLAHPQADFFEVQREVLQPFEGNVPLNVISPRMFEAIAFRTALILFPGHYSGVLRPWVHYIPLKKDFSNMDEVVTMLKDEKFLRSLTEQAYVDIVASGRYSYSVLQKDFLKAIDRHTRPYAKRTKIRYWLSRAERRYRLSSTNQILCRWWYPIQKRMLAKAQRAFIFLKVFVEVKLVREFVWWYVRHWNAWRLRPPKDTFLDLLFLGILKEASTKRLMPNNPGMFIEPCFDLKSGKASFKTKMITPTHRNYPAGTQERLWATFEAALKAGSVSELVWDNSQAGQNFLYPIIGQLYVPVWVNKGGRRKFEILVTLAVQLRFEHTDKHTQATIS